MPPRTKLLAEAVGAVTPPPAALPAAVAAPVGAVATPSAVKPAVATAAATGAATGAAVAQRRSPGRQQKASPEMLAASGDAWMEEAQQRKEALEAVGRIRDLQRAGQIGEVQMSTAPGETRRPSMQPLTVHAGERPTPGGGTLSSRPDRAVSPTIAPRTVEWERKPMQELANQAIGAGRLFTAAISAYDKGKANLEAKIQSGAVAPIDYKKLAEDQQRRLQDVLNLAAQMREYGYVGTNEQLMDKFAPK